MELDISLIEEMLTVTGWTRFHTFLFLNSFSGYFFASIWLTHLHLLHATVYPLSNLTKLSEIWTLIFRLCIAVGALIWGCLADRYGRNIAARTSILALFTFSFLSVFGRCEWELVGCVVGMGLGAGGEIVSGGVILSEYLPRNKIHAVLMSTAGMSFGALIGVGLCEGMKEINVMQIETWRLIFAVNAGMEVILLMMKLRMEETPKFLWKRDKQVEAEKLIDMVWTR
jgi:MFS family permease